MLAAAAARMNLSMAVGVHVRLLVRVGEFVAMLVDAASLFLESSGIRNHTAIFHFDRFREENIVLEMNVLMKVFLKSFNCREDRLVLKAGIRRDLEVVR